MATVTYNGVSISNCKVTRFSIENEYEGGNFNRTAKRCILEGVGTIASTNFDTSVASVRGALNIPGKALSITFTDTGTAYALADGYAGTAGIQDVKNGPLPVVNITEIIGTSNRVALVVGFTFTWNDCNASPFQRVEIVTTHSLNEDGILRVHRRGFLNVSASNDGTNTLTDQSPNTTNVLAPPAIPGTLTPTTAPSNPDLYRRFVSGPPAPGFQRTKQEFYVQADQTTLAFDIEDVQLINSLPDPAINGDASFDYERSLSNPMGTKTFRIELVGNPAEPKANLFVRCLEVALTRIRFVGENADICQSFKISEPSLFKRNSVILEIVAMGHITGTGNDDPISPGQTDAWLSTVLFSAPYATESTAPTSSLVDPYGRFKEGTVSPPTFVPVKYDPCTLANSWIQITGTPKATNVTTTGVVKEERPAQEPPANTAKKPGEPDPKLKEQSASIRNYKAFQSMDVVTNVDLLDAMGGDIQSAFQFAMPYALMKQTVEMVTNKKDAAIPWPPVFDQYVVTALNIVVNDGPPDASGNRVYAIRAERTVRINVPMSMNAWITGGQVGGNTSFASGDGGPSARLVNYAPPALASGVNPFAGWELVDVRANQNGTITWQNYSSGPATLG